MQRGAEFVKLYIVDITINPRAEAADLLHKRKLKAALFTVSVRKTTAPPHGVILQSRVAFTS